MFTTTPNMSIIRVTMMLIDYKDDDDDDGDDGNENNDNDDLP